MKRNEIKRQERNETSKKTSKNKYCKIGYKYFYFLLLFLNKTRRKKTKLNCVFVS